VATLRWRIESPAMVLAGAGCTLSDSLRSLGPSIQVSLAPGRGCSSHGTVEPAVAAAEALGNLLGTKRLNAAHGAGCMIDAAVPGFAAERHSVRRTS